MIGKMNETEIRALIDEQLRKVGWEADTNNLPKRAVKAPCFSCGDETPQKKLQNTTIGFIIK